MTTSHRHGGEGRVADAAGPVEPKLDPSGEMSFLEHLGVLRVHVMRALLWFSLAAVIAFLFVDRAWDFLMIPLCRVLPDRCFVYPRELLESFWVFFKLGSLIAFFISFPGLFLEAWAFVAPGLYAHERKVALPFAFAAGLLFLGGASFGFFFVFPATFEMLFGIGNGKFVFLTSMQSYFSFCATLLIVFGAIFELPLLMMAFAGIGVVKPRWFRRYRRLMYLAMLIFSAVVTPTTDPLTMMMMGGPMLVLYEIGILLSVLVHRNRDEPLAAA